MAEFTLDPAPGPPAWFAEHSLITNSTIRNYLKQYSQHAWPEITKLTLIYGILALQHTYKGQVLSLQQLKQVVQSSATTIVVQSNVPQLQRQILDLQSQLDNVFDKLAVQPLQVSQSPEQLERPSSQLPQQQLPTSRPQQQVQVQPPHLPQQQWQQPARAQQQQELQLEQIPPPAEGPPRQAGLNVLRARQGRTRNPAITAPKPSDAWRQGEPSGFTSPPRVHCRSQDNQGATNPIYPDWWLAEPTAEQLAEQQRQQLQQQQQKPSRPQPRLAYSVPKQPQQQDITADDLVTAEYLVVPGSGYGQHKQQLVPSEHDPPITVTHITPSMIATSHAVPQQQQQQQGCEQASKQRQDMDRQLPPPAVQPSVSVTSGRAALSRVRRQQAPVISRGSPRLSRVGSKIKQAVAASKQQAAAKQDHRQRLLTAVVATSSQQQQQRPVAVPVEESCPPAATAEQFIANPWTSWFLPESAPDRAARSGSAMAAATAAAAAEEAEAQQAQVGQQEQELAGYVDAESNSGNLDCSAVADLVWLQPATVEEAAAGSAEDSGIMQRAAGAAGRARGALCDITLNLNQQQPAGAGGTDDSSCKQQWQPLRMQGSGSSLGSFAFAPAPVAAENSSTRQSTAACMAAVHHGAASQEEQKRQQQQQERRQAWAADFGHLDSAQLEATVTEVQRAAQARGQRRPPHQRQQWSQKWVGNFGHLLTGPRFCEETAFSHHRATEDQGTAAGSSRDVAAADEAAGTTAATSTFMMSPAALDDLLVAGKAFNQHHDAAEAAISPERAADATLLQEDPGQELRSAGVSLLEQWQQLAAAAHAEIQQIAADATADGPNSAEAVAEGPDLLRLPADVQETGSPTKRAAAPAASAEAAVGGSGGSKASGLGDESVAGDESGESDADLAVDDDVAEAADLADEYLLGLQDTSRMLQQALQQHSSVMQLVGFLDDGQGQQQQQQQQQMAQGQQEAADAVDNRAAVHTATWVAAAAAGGYKEHDD